MNTSGIAADLDRAGNVVASAWAYEMALSHEERGVETILNLVAIYVSAYDSGFASHHHLPRVFVDAAYYRARELLVSPPSEGEEHPDVVAWRLHLDERVVGAPIDTPLLLNAAAAPESEFAKILAYVERVGSLESAIPIFEAALAGNTARQRYYLTYAPRYLLHPA